MNILVISDLHLGTGDQFGTFGWSNRDFISMVQHLIENQKIDQVILNGDIFELYKYRFKDVCRKNWELLSFFREVKAIYIKGNHDFISPLGKFQHTIVNSQGKKIYIEHGHEADFLNGTRIGRQIGLALHMLLKRIIRFKWVQSVYFDTINALEDVNKVPRKYNTYKYLKHALNLLRSYDVVLMGHTHKIESHNTYFLNQKKQYCNSGSCSLGRFQAIVVDTESLKCETIKLSKVECEAILGKHKLAKIVSLKSA